MLPAGTLGTRSVPEGYINIVRISIDIFLNIGTLSVHGLQQVQQQI